MDVNTLVKLVMSANSTNALSQKAGISADQVTSILSNVLPSLLKGASSQATNTTTAASFLQAIENHGVKDTKDLGSFLGGVDLADGAKIVQHLLGGNAASTALTAAKAAGVSEKDVLKILAMVAPLLLTILGQQKKKHGNEGSALLQTVLSGAAGKGLDAGAVLGLLGKLMK